MEGTLQGCDATCVGRVSSVDNRFVEFARPNGEKLLRLSADDLPTKCTCTDSDDLVIEDRNQQGRIRIRPRDYRRLT